MTQINQYINQAAVIKDTDLFDSDVDMGLGVFESQKVPANILQEYVLGSGSENFLTKRGAGGVGISDSIIQDAGSNIGIGVAPSAGILFYMFNTSNDNSNTAVFNTQNTVNAPETSVGLSVANSNSGGADTLGINVIAANFGSGSAYIGRFQDGSEGLGKVLTDIDGSGTATWQTASGGSNIYSANGVLTSDRVVGVGAYRLSFDGVYVFGTTHPVYANKVGVNTLTPSAVLSVKGLGTTSATYAAAFENSIGTNLFQILDNGDIGGVRISSNRGGSDNLTFGVNAGNSLNLSSNSNVLLGSGSGSSISSATTNIGVGSLTLAAVTTAPENVAVGHGACQNITNSGNTGIGYAACAGSGGNGYENVAIGNRALVGFSSGHSNVVVGARSGTGITTGFQNVIIGSNTGNLLTTQSNQLIIDVTNTATPLLQGDFSARTLIINGDFAATGTVVNFANLPTSSAGLIAGDIWNNSGIINIV